MKNKLFMLLALSFFAAPALAETSDSDYKAFKIFGDNYLDLNFRQNVEITTATISGPGISQIFGRSVETIQVSIRSPLCKERPNDATIQRCSQLGGSAILLDSSGNIVEDINSIRSVQISTFTTKVLTEDPARDFNLRSFHFVISTEKYPDVEINAEQRVSN